MTEARSRLTEPRSRIDRGEVKIDRAEVNQGLAQARPGLGLWPRPGLVLVDRELIASASPRLRLVSA